MTNHIMRHVRYPLTLAALLTVSSCGGETIVQPTFGSGCSAGSLRVGQAIEGVFTEESCTVPYNFWSGNKTPYVSYSVSLQKDKGYWFYLRQIPDGDELNDVDALLTLYGKDESGASVPLAVSDDDAAGIDGHDSEFYFVAPRSGTFNLVAASCAFDELGGYRLTMAECPVIAVLDTVGTYASLPFEESNCLRHDIANSGGASRIVLFSIPADALETVGVAVTSDEFEPIVEMGGPLFDTYANIYEGAAFTSSSAFPAVVTIVQGDVAGGLTLAVGASVVDPAGNFTVVLSRTAAPPGAPSAAPSAQMTMKSLFGNTPRKQR